MIHAHIDSYAVDCDGPIARSHVMTMTEEEKAAEFGDIEFHGRVITSVVNTYSLFANGRLEVKATEHGARLDWTERTEEGFRNISAHICEADCATDETSYRDIRAEAAGY